VGLAVQTLGLGKQYRLGEDFGRYLTIRESLAGALRRSSRDRAERELWALRGIDLTVEEGEVVGVIGRNGAGKTTLLKLLARITEPTTGMSRTRGRVGTLLEVGTGFHPELTGRENVYLNGAILGMSRDEIRQRFDEIVEFAAVERFLDTPLKRYSSGMNLRLAFAVAAHMNAPIVVVDEVLAVGDAEFQQKCLGKMAEMTQAGRTVVFVSHDLGAIRQLCPRTVWLDEGRVKADGPSAEVIDEYLSSSAGGATSVEFHPQGDQAVELLAVAVTDEQGAPMDVARRDRPFVINIRFATRTRLPDLDVGVNLIDQRGTYVLIETFSDTEGWRGALAMPGEYQVALAIPPVLAAGNYVVGVWIGSTIGQVDETFLDREVLTLQLGPGLHDRRESIDRPRVVQPQVRWELTRPEADSEHGSR
jgi:ABC-type polysaccharide/polyol phosphate transport system ATPase subunit